MTVKETWTEYEFALDIMTPVIINTGDAYEFGEIYLDSKRQISSNKICVLQVNMQKVLPLMSSEKIKAFVDCASKGVIENNKSKKREAYTMIASVVEKHVQAVTIRPMTGCPEFLEKMEEDPGIIVQRIASNPLNGKPYIPGSSIKGALRTAILEQLRKQKEHEDTEYYNRPMFSMKSKDFEANLYCGQERFKVSDDVFKYLKVSDFQFENLKINTWLGALSVNEIPVYSAMTDATCLHDWAGQVVAKGTISISSKAPKFFAIENILEAVSSFYVGNLNHKNIGESKAFPIDKITNCNKNESLIRLGHYSGIENMTLKTIQDVSRSRRNKNEKINTEGGKSRILVESKYPLGYCHLRKI